MTLTGQPADKPHLRVTFQRDPSACLDILATVTSWSAADPQTITLFDASGQAVLLFTSRDDSSEAIYRDADDEFYIERLGDVGTNPLE